MWLYTIVQGHRRMVYSVAWSCDSHVTPDRCNLFSSGFDNKVVGWKISWWTVNWNLSINYCFTFCYILFCTFPGQVEVLWDILKTFCIGQYNSIEDASFCAMIDQIYRSKYKTTFCNIWLVYRGTQLLQEQNQWSQLMPRYIADLGVSRIVNIQPAWLVG